MLFNNAGVTLFEVSWEVCNKVGGIHAVVSSKALEAVEQLEDRYFLIGPDLKQNAEFEETDEAFWEPLKVALAVRDIKCRFGRWNIPGRPKTILVSFAGRYNQNQILGELWTRYGVDSLTGGWDYIEPVLFSTVCADVIEAAHQTLVKPQLGYSIAHFHEWMCGAGLLALKTKAPDIGTVFTTHATVLGRAMAGSGVNIYRQMHQISPAQEAAAHNITAKCSMESIAAKEADCFTTVSNITGSEAEVFLGRKPDILTLNGLDLRTIPNYSQDRAKANENKRHLLGCASKLFRKQLPDNTRVFIISGRYEFHNKGVDVFLDALAGVEQAVQQTSSNILAICAVMGGHQGVSPSAVSGDPAVASDQGPGWISSHYVHDMPNDPILRACNRLQLVNGADNNVNVMFIPCLLDGNDGFLNLPYYDVLTACDLGLFPSWYEPWGYTPQESAAHAVPTVTTDLSGFGLWARDLEEQRGGRSGVTVVARDESTYEQVVADLKTIMLEYMSLPDEVLETRRNAVRHLAQSCTWKEFYPWYLEAYSKALGKVVERGIVPGVEKRAVLARTLQHGASTTPNLHLISAVAELPASLRRLRELAMNLWWSWHGDAWRLFEQINPAQWDAWDHNPIRVIEEAAPNVLQDLAASRDYMELYTRVLEEFDAYMVEEPQAIGGDVSTRQPIAYFSTEYGFHESLPIYSGGLGVLSGDHLKSASDLNIPLVAVGLLYRNGYFRQQLDATGRQIPIYPENNFDYLPLERLQDTEGNALIIDLELPGRQLFAQVWLVKIGRIKLFLLDTDIAKNTPGDRKITGRLYVADRETRLCQEILLGMGGARLLWRLSIWPAVYHMNEGHSAFMVFERIQRYMREDKLSLEAAKELVRSNTIFTTHTPVDAGNERFSIDLIGRYFSGYATSIGLSMQELLRFGQGEDDSRRTFEMTVLALKMSAKANGVSRMHALVSRHMWRSLWPGVPVAEVPIGHVTNGVHVASYVGRPMRMLLEGYLGRSCLQTPQDALLWEKTDSLPLSDLSAAMLKQKGALFALIRASLPAFFQKYDISKEDQVAYVEAVAVAKLDTLVVCFARRFAPYKRAGLIFADLDRLDRIVNSQKKPVTLVFSGKAHPADEEGIKLIQSVIQQCVSPRFKGRIFFLEDYSLKVSRLMVQGGDVWLNTPRRPYEASGTSGQKVSVNGGLNLSVSDGWWCEGQQEENGWTIGPVVHDCLPDAGHHDYADAESLYSLLEETVVPMYYERSVAGFPEKWLKYVKRSIKTLVGQFSSGRMVAEYLEHYYIPAATAYAQLHENNRARLTRIVDWQKSIARRFATLEIGRLEVDALDGDALVCGQPFTVKLNLKLGEMSLEEILPQLVIGPANCDDFAALPEMINLQPILQEDGSYSCTGSYTAIHSGRYAFGVRVVPMIKELDSYLHTHLVVWA